MQIKGMVISARKEFVDEHFGPGAWEKVVESLSPDDQGFFKDLVLTAKWYPFEVGERLDNAIVGVLGEGDEEIFEEIGAKSAKKSLTQVHKSFLTPGDPQAFMRKADLIYKFFYDTGHREYKETGPSSGIMTTYDVKTFSVPDCLTVIGWYKEALHMCGAKNVEIEEEECRARGGKCCRYAVSWD